MKIILPQFPLACLVYKEFYQGTQTKRRSKIAKVFLNLNTFQITCIGI